MAILSIETRETIDFDRVLGLVSDRAVNETGAARVCALQPSDEISVIEARFDRLDEMLSISTNEATFRPPEMPDITEQLARLTKPGVVLEAEDIITIGDVLEAAASVKKYILRREDDLPALSSDVHAIDELEGMLSRIKRTFDENGEVASSASPVLGKLRSDMRNIRDRVEARLGKMADKLEKSGSSGDNFTTVRQERYVIAVRRDEMRKCPGIIQGESGSGTTLFIEPEEVVSLNNRLRETELDIRREIIRILAALSDELIRNRPLMETDFKILVELDSLYARAQFATLYQCNRPVFSQKGTTNLIDAYHPLLLCRRFPDGVLDIKSKDNPIIPLNLNLGEGEKTLLVSGPNAGGKTVLLKTFALTAALAQCGIFPPVAEKSKLPIISRMFVAIGDEQSIDKDLSTFSSHVADLTKTLDGAGPGSLVLLDEIGVGTDPAEGAALAASVLEELTSRGCITISTTHYGELKLLHERVPGLVNGSLEFDSEKMLPTFHFRKGLPGQSYGIQIAQNMGMDSHLLDKARSYMKGETLNVNAYLARLEKDHEELMDARARLEKEIRQVESIREAAESSRVQAENMEREISRLRKEFDRESAALRRRQMLDDRRDVEKIITELRESYNAEQRTEAEKAARKAVEDRISDLGEKLREREKEQAKTGKAKKDNTKLSPGDNVKIASLGLNGEIVEGPDAAGKYVVIVGRLKMSLDSDDLTRTGGRKKRRVSVFTGSTDSNEPVSVSDRLDLRGMRVDEVNLEVDRFLDGAVMSGLKNVTVVHGKGTGALRVRVGEILQGDRRVDSFRLGSWNEGGSGATIVNLH